MKYSFSKLIETCLQTGKTNKSQISKKDASPIHNYFKYKFLFDLFDLNVIYCVFSEKLSLESAFLFL